MYKLSQTKGNEIMNFKERKKFHFLLFFANILQMKCVKCVKLLIEFLNSTFFAHCFLNLRFFLHL